MPKQSLDKLQHTHLAGARLLESGGFTPESNAVAVEVERHRWYWRPSKPRILLVAESHVYTSNEDLALKIDTAKLKAFGGAGVVPPPENFVRLVHCLGYGEPLLLQQAPKYHRNTGTEHYWNMFRRVSNLGGSVPSSRADFDMRLRWKIETLRNLYLQRIWLLDASVHAIYLGSGRRLPIDVQRQLHEQWWDGYGRHIIEACGNPKIWVVGKTAFNCLSGIPSWRCQGWVYQPNYDREKNWRELLKDCREL